MKNGRRTGYESKKAAELDRLAMMVSRFTYPTVFCIPVFLIISSFSMPWPDWMVPFLACFMFATLLPMAMVLSWTRWTGQDSINIPLRKGRAAPLAMCIISYLVGTAVLATMNAPLIITGLMFCYFANTLFVFFVNLLWKISIHSMGVAGPTVAMVFAFGYPGLVMGALIPLIMWSRVWLEQHTVAQVTAGAGFGLLLTALQLSMIL